MSKFDYLSELDIDVLMDMLLDEGDNLKTAQENLTLFAPYSGLEKRYTAAVSSAIAQIDAIRAEIKRRAKP